LYALDDSVWGMKITALEESTDFATLDIEKLFSKLKSHELSRKGRPNHDASLTGKAFVTSTHVGGHVSNSTNITDSSALEFALSSLAVASDKQYESIPDDEIVLLARKFLNEEEITEELLLVRRHHPLHHRLLQAGEARLLQQVQQQQSERLQQQGRGQEEVPLQGQEEEEVLEDDAPCMCCPQRPHLLQR
jgi:hypothetical protein